MVEEFHVSCHLPCIIHESFTVLGIRASSGFNEKMSQLKIGEKQKIRIYTEYIYICPRDYI